MELTMTKADREEFAKRLAMLDHYRRLAIESCINYGLTSKRAVLAKLREEQGDI